jgi:hypothetical protein
MLVFTPLTKTIKLLSFDDNDFKIAHPSDFFLSDDNDTFLTNRRVYTSYRIVSLSFCLRTQSHRTLLLENFALVFEITCTEINQSQSSNIVMYIIIECITPNNLFH